MKHVIRVMRRHDLTNFRFWENFHILEKFSDFQKNVQIFRKNLDLQGNFQICGEIFRFAGKFSDLRGESDSRHLIRVMRRHDLTKMGYDNGHAI